jgi:hypothetical protein
VNEMKWLSVAANRELIARVDEQIEREREAAVASPMPVPESAIGGVYCEGGCHQVKPKYGMPKVRPAPTGARLHESDAAVHLK